MDPKGPEGNSVMDPFFYNPMEPAWLGFVLAGLLFLLGANSFAQWRRVNHRDLIAGIVSWIVSGMLVYVAFGLSYVNGALYGWATHYNAVTSPSAPYPAVVLQVVAWVIPAIGLAVFVLNLLFWNPLRVAISVFILIASFTMLSYMMLLATFADDWALVTTFSWFATGAAVIYLIGTMLYFGAFSPSTKPEPDKPEVPYTDAHGMTEGEGPVEP
jgi:hypothetical protein